MGDFGQSWGIQGALGFVGNVEGLPQVPASCLVYAEMTREKVQWSTALEGILRNCLFRHGEK